MPSRLTEIGDALRGVSARAEALGASLTPKQMLLRPEPNRWSPGECLAHLTVTANAYAPVWRDAFAAARQRGAHGSEPYRMDFMGRMLNWSLEPGRNRYKAPTHMQPINVASGEAALEAFLDSQRMVQQFVDEGAGLPLDRMKIASPAVAAIRYSVWSSFVIIGTHGQRHLAQAEATASASR
jgi:hypothetical protein